MTGEIITSKDNKIFKKINSLENKKYRDKYNQYILEGVKLVSEAIDKDIVEVVIIREDKIKSFEKIKALEDYKGRFVFMEGKLFDRLTRTKTSQGIFAVVKKADITKEKFIELAENKNILILDRLQDPGNIGTIIRTALAAGYGGCIVIKASADIYSSKIVSASSNALLKLPIYIAENEEEALDICKRLDNIIIGTKLDAVDYESVDKDNKVAIIIGNEGNGISESLLEKTDINVKIPMSKEVESLNAAVSAAILMYRWKGI